MLHAGGSGRPRVQLVVQGPGASEVVAELEQRLELLRDATRVDFADTAAVRRGTAVQVPPSRDAAWTDSPSEANASDDSWEVAERSTPGVDPPLPLWGPTYGLFNDLPLDVRRLPTQLGGSDDSNRRRIHSAWSQGIADRDLLAYDPRADLPAAAHEQNHDLVAGLQLKWHVVLRTATPSNQASFVTCRSRLAHSSTHTARAHLAYTLARRFASLAEALAYCRGTGLDELPRRL